MEENKSFYQMYYSKMIDIKSKINEKKEELSLLKYSHHVENIQEKQKSYMFQEGMYVVLKDQRTEKSFLYEKKKQWWNGQIRMKPTKQNITGKDKMCIFKIEEINKEFWLFVAHLHHSFAGWIRASFVNKLKEEESFWERYGEKIKNKRNTMELKNGDIVKGFYWMETKDGQRKKEIIGECFMQGKSCYVLNDDYLNSKKKENIVSYLSEKEKLSSILHSYEVLPFSSLEDIHLIGLVEDRWDRLSVPPINILTKEEKKDALLLQEKEDWKYQIVLFKRRR